jgi:hypothetical protein
MKARILLIGCLLFSAGSLLGQTTSSQRLMIINVPFSFGVGDQSLPAGQYHIFTVSPERSIRITHANGKHSAIVHTMPHYASSPSENNHLVFHRYADKYFLTEVWTAGQDVARNPMLSKRAIE